jgi:hypothetical protein
MIKQEKDLVGEIIKLSSSLSYILIDSPSSFFVDSAFVKRRTP